MKKICAYLLAAAALMATGAASTGTVFWLLDEPKNSVFDD